MVLRGSLIPRLVALCHPEMKTKEGACLGWVKNIRIWHEKVVSLGQVQPSPASVCLLGDEVLH